MVEKNELLCWLMLIMMVIMMINTTYNIIKLLSFSSSLLQQQKINWREEPLAIWTSTLLLEVPEAGEFFDVFTCLSIHARAKGCTYIICDRSVITFIAITMLTVLGAVWWWCFQLLSRWCYNDDRNNDDDITHKCNIFMIHGILMMSMKIVWAQVRSV